MPGLSLPYRSKASRTAFTAALSAGALYARFRDDGRATIQGELLAPVLSEGLPSMIEPQEALPLESSAQSATAEAHDLPQL